MNRSIAEATSQLSEQHFKSLTKSIHALYVDAECFQDFNLGALTLLVKHNPDEYKYMVDNLEVYNTRERMGTMECFPDLPYTNADIEEVLKDSAKVADVCAVSPWTEYFYNFKAFINMLHDYNRRSMSPGTLQIHIGSSTFKYPAHQFGLIKSYAGLMWPGVNISQTVHYSEMDQMLVDALGHFSICDSQRFLEVDAIIKRLNEDSLFDCSVHGFHFISTDFEPENQEDLINAINNTERIYNSLCDFKFVNKDIRICQN